MDSSILSNGFARRSSAGCEYSTSSRVPISAAPVGVDSESDDDERIQIHTDTMDLTGFDVLDEPTPKVESADIFLEAEELP